MGCCGGDREKDALIKNDVKWEYVNLNDFKSTSCFTPFAYVYLWLMLIVSISVYAVDTFTAINLLAFNRWAGQIKPAIDLKYSRWIFAGCIIVSFILLIYRWIRALKAMRGGKVAKAYLDPLAVRVECIRMGKEGRGWKRFLVFAELTKSRKGADYVALFTYYSFEAWLRIVFAEGPRTVINGITLVAYAQANLVPAGNHDTPQGQSPFVQFWKNFGQLAEDDKLQMAIIIGMLWTCFIWLISAISLAVSLILYLIFLWHHIPSDAGGLKGYCRTKINRRMERIVRTKTDKALKKENELRERQEAKAFREGTSFKRQPTLPEFVNTPTSTLPPLSRQTTMSTLPEYSSRPGTAPPGDAMPTLPNLAPLDTQSRPPLGPRRHMTNASDASWSSYNSSAPLMNSSGEGVYSPADRVQTPASNVSTPWSARPGPGRNFTDYGPYGDRTNTPGPPRPGTAQSMRNAHPTYPLEPINRPGTGMSSRSRNTRQPSDSDFVPPPRGTTPASSMPQSATSIYAPPLPDPHRTRTPVADVNPYFPPITPIHEDTTDIRSKAPLSQPPRSFTPGHQPPLSRSYAASPFQGDTHTGTQPGSEARAGGAEYVAFSPHGPPTTSATPAPGASYQSFQQPASSSLHPPRSQAPPRANSFDDILDHY